jgi:hypothetical protein
VKRLTLSLVLIPFALSFLGCGGETQTAEERVQSAIRRTQAQSRSFIYQDQGVEAEVAVRGVIQDDYRYKARVSFGGNDTLDEVAVDDALAVRFLDPEAVDDYLLRAGATAAPSGETLGLLRSRRWVRDPTGAPDLTSPSIQRLSVGQDHVLDALNVFLYVENAIQEAETVARFNPEALDYIEKEDRFPRPKEGSPVMRYDLRPPEIPPFAGVGATLPDIRHFRKVSVYIKGGEVLQVMEEIDLASRYDRLVEALDLEVPAQLSGGERLAFAVDALNQLRSTRRTAPIRIRRMSLEVIDLGKPNLVQLPDSAVDASLSLLANRGRGAGARAQAGT